ncbi:hypothetical protein CP974_03040 [Streptomyces fradiae ATCC 10745 = DSM 40063]|nr:hypothetical protein CP974_03040 [Streptomyces fradiae ATCC 10745 = DSM 40063]
MSDPVFVGLPGPDPVPAPGCDVCAALHKQWKQASDPTSPARNPSHAVDLAIEMRRHPHPRAGAR